MSWLFVGHVDGPSSEFNILVGEGTSSVKYDNNMSNDGSQYADNDDEKLQNRVVMEVFANISAMKAIYAHLQCT